MIEPGGVKTPIWGKGNDSADETAADMPPEAERLYGAMFESLRGRIAQIEQETGLPPQEVAETIGQALTAERPKTRYMVGGDARSRSLLARLLPDRVFDRLILRALG